MQAGLAKIKTLAGVHASFICDNRGEVVVSALSGGLDMATLTSIGREVTLIMAATEAAGEAMGELDCRYERVRLVVRTLTHAVFVVLCDPQIDIAMLRLALDVETARFKGDSEIQRQFQARAIGRREVVQGDVDEASWHLFTLLAKGGKDSG
jgi:predicted regulator of Ras-like GTPase activity (Roadblock/LC7/MglB family)